MKTSSASKRHVTLANGQWRRKGRDGGMHKQRNELNESELKTKACQWFQARENASNKDSLHHYSFSASTNCFSNTCHFLIHSRRFHPFQSNINELDGTEVPQITIDFDGDGFVSLADVKFFHLLLRLVESKYSFRRKEAKCTVATRKKNIFLP